MARQYSIRGIASLVLGLMAWCPWGMIMISYALSKARGPTRGLQPGMDPGMPPIGVVVDILIGSIILIHLLAFSVLFATTGLILGISEWKRDDRKTVFSIAGIWVSAPLLVFFVILNLWGLLYTLSVAPLGTMFVLLLLFALNLIGFSMFRRCSPRSVRENASLVVGLVGWFPSAIFWVVSAPLLAFLVIIYVGGVLRMLYVAPLDTTIVLLLLFGLGSIGFNVRRLCSLRSVRENASLILGLVGWCPLAISIVVLAMSFPHPLEFAMRPGFIVTHVCSFPFVLAGLILGILEWKRDDRKTVFSIAGIFVSSLALFYLGIYAVFLLEYQAAL